MCMAEGVGPAVLPALPKPFVGRRGAVVLMVTVEVGTPGDAFLIGGDLIGAVRPRAGVPRATVGMARGAAGRPTLAAFGACLVVTGLALAAGTVRIAGAGFLPRLRSAHVRQIDCVGGALTPGLLLPLLLRGDAPPALPPERLEILAAGTRRGVLGGTRRLGERGVLALLRVLALLGVCLLEVLALLGVRLLGVRLLGDLGQRRLDEGTHFLVLMLVGHF